MARYPKGSKGNKEKPIQDAQEPVHGSKPEVQTPEVKEPEKVTAAGTVAPFDTCRYHKDFPPRLFREGEVIPEGWQETRAGMGWVIDESNGTWSKK